MDINILAKHIVDQAIGDKTTKKPNPRASIRGKARAEVLTADRRKAIAKKAAEVRWIPRHEPKSGPNQGE